jgi:hypothetical protein
MSDQPYHLADRGQSLGTFASPEVLAGLATGRLSPEVLSWREGEPGWIALRARPEFASGISAGSSLQAPPPAMPWEAEVGSWSAIPRPAQYWRTAKAVLFRPAATFSGEASGDLRAPLQWLVWSSVAAILIGFPLWSILLSLRPALFAFFKVKEAASPAVFNLTYYGRAAVLYPAVVIAATFALAFLMHGLVRLFGGGAGGWRRSFRALAYVAGSFCFVFALPLTACATPIWAFIASFQAVGYAHREPAWRGFIALALLSGVGCCGGAIASLWSYSRNFIR